MDYREIDARLAASSSQFLRKQKIRDDSKRFKTILSREKYQINGFRLESRDDGAGKTNSRYDIRCRFLRIEEKPILKECTDIAGLPSFYEPGGKYACHNGADKFCKPKEQKNGIPCGIPFFCSGLAGCPQISHISSDGGIGHG